MTCPAPSLREFLARHLEAALIEIDRGDAPARLGETEGRGAADPAAATRHHADAA